MDVHEFVSCEPCKEKGKGSRWCDSCMANQAAIRFWESSSAKHSTRAKKFKRIATALKTAVDLLTISEVQYIVTTKEDDDG